MSWFRRFIPKASEAVNAADLPIEETMPKLAGIGPWFNSTPLSATELKDKVVLVDFWTYSCINCLHTLPYLNAWHKNYAKDGLVVIGIHTPEFEFEKDPANVAAALKKYGIEYPVMMDNDYALWKAYKNRYWPAHYFVDRNGKIRFHHFGEGEYAHSEAVIRALLSESGTMPETPSVSASIVNDVVLEKIGTPETYLGHERVEYLGSPEPIREDTPQRYTAAKSPAKNVFYLEGLWELHAEYAESKEPGTTIIYKVTASKVNLVLEGPQGGGRVEIFSDGRPLPEKILGKDARLIDSRSIVSAKEARLYSLLEAPGDYRERPIKIVFLDPDIKAFAFTFS